MVEHQVKADGTCSTCNSAVNKKHIVECYSCKNIYHGDCNNVGTFCSKSFLKNFKGLQNNPCFVFVCPTCVTISEHVAASTMKQQLAEVIAAVAQLTKEVQELRSEKSEESGNQLDQPQINSKDKELKKSAWDDSKRLRKVKEDVVTLCIKSDGQPVDVAEVKEVVTSHGIQVTKASVSKKSGDMYIDLPSIDSRDKLLPLLNEASIPGNRVINVKQKCPTISIRNVIDYEDEDQFIEKVKNQNPKIKEKISGSEFSVVFTKEPKIASYLHADRFGRGSENAGHLVVIRIGNDIRDVLKANNDKIFLGFNAHRVMDRFYVKSCGKCHKFGHYHADCPSTSSCCGFCLAEDHTSEQCEIAKDKDYASFKCAKCKEAGKPYEGHSSHFSKCPTFLDVQERTKNNIPYYLKNRQ